MFLLGGAGNDCVLVFCVLFGGFVVKKECFRRLEGKHAPREIQRELSFKSPALAAYHLDKLMDLGLVDNVGGEYRVTEVVEVGVLKQFMKIGSFMIPRYVTYATMISILFVFFLSQFRALNFYSLFALIFGALSTVIFWYETFRVWRSRP